MRVPTLTACCVAACTAATITACGGDPPAPGPARPGPVAATPAPDPGLSERCGLPPIRADAAPDAVPAELRLPGSQVASARRSGSAVTATVLIPLSLAAAYQALVELGPRAGYEVAFSEFEGFDGEIYLRNDSGLVKFRLRPSGSCENASQALFQRAVLDG